MACRRHPMYVRFSIWKKGVPLPVLSLKWSGRLWVRALKSLETKDPIRFLRYFCNHSHQTVGWRQWLERKKTSATMPRVKSQRLFSYNDCTIRQDPWDGLSRSPTICWCLASQGFLAPSCAAIPWTLKRRPESTSKWGSLIGRTKWKGKCLRVPSCLTDRNNTATFAPGPDPLHMHHLLRYLLSLLVFSCSRLVQASKCVLGAGAPDAHFILRVSKVWKCALAT